MRGAAVDRGENERVDDPRLHLATVPGHGPCGHVAVPGTAKRV
jgi:hypothetical protein